MLTIYEKSLLHLLFNSSVFCILTPSPLLPPSTISILPSCLPSFLSSLILTVFHFILFAQQMSPYTYDLSKPPRYNKAKFVYPSVPWTQLIIIQCKIQCRKSESHYGSQGEVVLVEAGVRLVNASLLQCMTSILMPKRTWWSNPD